MYEGSVLMIKEEKYYNVSSIIVKMIIEIEDCKKLVQFFDRDFGIYRAITTEEPDIVVTITNVPVTIPKTSCKLSNDIFFYDEKMYVRYNAAFRETWVSYGSKSCLGENITIHLPDKPFEEGLINNINKHLIRFLYPNYLHRWQNSLMDIFHGPLLGLLQINLLKKGKALLHASSIANINGEGVVFPGWAQSGKSTIADRLIKKKNWKFIAEDFVILSEKNKIISFPKQRRVYASQLKKTKYTSIQRTFMEKIFDNLNLSLYRLLKSSKSIRILSVDEIFNSEDIMKDASLNTVIFLKRGNFIEINLTRIEIETMANMCADMMFFEMQNFNGYYQLISAYGVMSGNSDLIKMITQNLRQIYISVFKETKCYILEVPETQELDFIENNLHFELENMILSKQDNQ